mmetsp:Transcript_115076/g.245846  ORF Transcript_115076/g.245846 Transcript_115076/m.245846 type:complete len:705 (+) Transcript_115076:100-2214(+)
MQLRRAARAAVLLAGLLATPAAALGAEAASGQSQAVTPVQKVAQMLTGMLDKAKLAKHEEQVQYAAYLQFCTDVQKEKAQSVKVADERIEILKADIQMSETEASTAAKKIETVDSDIAVWNADIKAANKIRELERADYLKAHKDYSDTMDAIAKAVQVLRALPTNAAQAAAAASLLEELKGLGNKKGVAPAAGHAITAFLSRYTEEPPVPAADGEAYAYESRSTSIYDMLEKLRDKFSDERTELEKEEMNRRHAHEMLVQDMSDSIKTAEGTRSSKVTQRANELQSAANMKSELDDTTLTRTDDQKYLTDVTTTCSQKKVDFEDRQKIREEELVAVQKAIEILSSDAVMATTDRTYGASSVLQLRGPALVQLRSRSAGPGQARAAAYLHEQGERIHSRVLSALAIRARDDPFAKVKKMIKDLIMRLMEEASEEAQHKGWCDTELAQNEQDRTSRASLVERLTSEIDETQSSVSKLASEIAEHSTQLEELKANTAQETKLRSEMKAENEVTVKDAQEAQVAIGQAMTVLKEFYARAASSTALVQRQQGSAMGAGRQEPPPIFDSPYQGMEGGGGGIIAMLEVIQSDYARLESTASAMEATAQQDYDRLMTETAVSEAQIEKDIEHKTRRKQTEEQRLVDRNNDLVLGKKELEAANNYYEKLKPSCLDAGMSFQERDQRRQEEIQSLQEALRILNGEDIAVLQQTS